MLRTALLGTVGTVGLIALTAVACTSAVAGHGHGHGPGTAGRQRTNPQTSSSSSSTTSSSTSTPAAHTPSVTPGASPSGRTITVTGTTSRRHYRAVIWASDTITDCAAHAYGAAMLAFLRQHPCAPARRVLATVYAAGRAVDISSISTSFPGAGHDIYGPVERFKHLEQADGTGSIDDLLRDGATMPGYRGRIPSHEAFAVLGQDTGAQVLDAWYASGPTPDQDPALLHLEEDLFLSRLTAG